MRLILPFSEHDKSEVRRIKLFAEQNKVDSHTLAAMNEGFVKPAGKDKDYACKIGDDLTIAYSIEEQPCPVGWARHLSLSQRNGQLVGPDVTAIVMSFFDFKELNPLKSYFQLDEQTNPQTVHVIEPLDCKWEELDCEEELEDEI